MTIAVVHRDIRRVVLGFVGILALAFMGQGAFAAAPDMAVPEAATQADAGTDATETDAAAGADAAESAEGAYEYYGPDMIKGQPTSFEEDPWKSTQFQDQYTENGKYAMWMNNWILAPVIVFISAFHF